MTTTILLIRHAAHVELGRSLSGRRRDVALSKAGLGQAAILADLLGTEPITAIYSSPQERAWHTARGIAEPHALKVEIAGGLDEIDFGLWTGKSFTELENEPGWAGWNAARGIARCPAGESMTEVVDRAVGAIRDIAQLHDGRTIAIVTHADVIRGVVAHYLGLPLDRLLSFDVDPASVSRIEVGGQGGRVRSLNERLYQ